jgi:hypothetical protein
MTVKKTALALAALFVLSGGAMAAQSAKTKTKPAPACTQTTTNVDCVATGSVETPNTNAAPATTKGPRIGIDINPWIMPSTF